MSGRNGDIAIAGTLNRHLGEATPTARITGAGARVCAVAPGDDLLGGTGDDLLGGAGGGAD